MYVKLETWQKPATELNEEAFLQVKEESFPSHLSGLEKIMPLLTIHGVAFFAFNSGDLCESL